MLLIVAFTTGGFIVYGLEFLEDLPKRYECDIDGEWTECSQDYICSSGLHESEWQIDYSYPDTYHNWVAKNKLDLTCVKSSVIGFLGSAYFIGFSLGSALIPMYSEKMKLGRKWPYIASLVAQTLAYLGIFFSKNVYFTISMYILVGLASGGRVCIGTTYMNELIPSKNQAFATTSLNAADASVMLFQSVYYIFLKNWFYLHLFGMCFAVFVILNVCILPESPKDMYACYKFDEARKYLRVIARWNSVFNRNVDVDLVDKITFDTEVLGLKKPLSK